jgi:hypothetical protein
MCTTFQKSSVSGIGIPHKSSIVDSCSLIRHHGIIDKNVINGPGDIWNFDFPGSIVSRS